MKKDAVIIGGGVAGLWCASELSRLGFEAVIVEKGPYPGGNVAHYCCKATDQCQRCGACLLEDVLANVDSSSRIDWYLRADVTNVERRNGSFALVLNQRPARILPEKCNECGKCVDVCPVPGALGRSPLKNQLFIDEDICLFFKDGSCQACVSACPESAVDLKGPVQEVQVEASAAILAGGFKAFDPLEKPRFGYGRVPGVMTGLELESILRADSFDAGEADKAIRSVAFVQCVGSRDPKIGHNYCSRVCCGYALRLARLMRRRFPAIDPAMFYMDIQTFDRDFERRLEAARQEVRLIRAIPKEVRTGPDWKPEVTYHGPNDERIVESFDLVVLSVGISPDPALAGLAELLQVSSNQDGFFGLDGESVSAGSAGVFVAGAVQGPKSIEESVSHAIRTAGEVASFLKADRGEDK